MAQREEWQAKPGEVHLSVSFRGRVNKSMFWTDAYARVDEAVWLRKILRLPLEILQTSRSAMLCAGDILHVEDDGSNFGSTWIVVFTGIQRAMIPPRCGAPRPRK